MHARILVFLFTAACSTLHLSALEFFVSPLGNDARSGLSRSASSATNGPFKTLERARDAIRKSGRAGKEEIIVSVLGGQYSPARAFRLTKEDSGSAQFPVVYQSEPGFAVSITGGIYLELKPLNPEEQARLPESSRGSALKAEVSADQMSDFGRIGAAGGQLELFCRDEPMRLARWPNDEFVKVGAVLGKKPFASHGIKGDYEGLFRFEDERPTTWKNEAEIWLHGYWFWDWSDSFEQVERIDSAERSILLKQPYHHYGYRPGQRYYALNVLSELDQPGEWHLDREKRTLTVWPCEQKTIQASKLTTLVEIDGADHINLRGFTFKICRGTAVEINSSRGVAVEQCKIFNTGSYGVRIRGGESNRVSFCEIYQTGEGGIELSGGDRRSLRAAGHLANDNVIHHFGRIFRTYRPAVMVSGVGNRVEHNLIYDGPHNAIQLGGNEHRIEFNEVHHVCYETGDVGAFYMGRDWTARGTVIRHNYFHHIQGPGLHGAMAVYLDDAASGIEIIGNLFYKAGRAAFIGGGRDNRVINNIFVECAPSVHVDARGLGWMKDAAAENGVLRQRLAEMPYREPHWTNRYPELLTVLQDEPGAPRGNIVERNVSFGGRWLDLEKAAEPGVKFSDNWTEGDPGFIDRTNGVFQLKTDSPVYQKGFKRIPVEEIGPRKAAGPTAARNVRTPVIYCADLFHPHDDPDDHFDLAVMFALTNIDLKGIVLDQGRKQLEKPGRIPVSQLNKLHRRNVPSYLGLAEPLKKATDTGADQPSEFQEGVRFILETLRNSEQPVAIAAVGSMRDIAAAANREPDLFRKKVSQILVFVGEASSPDFIEYNVNLDPKAFDSLMGSRLPIYWVPCFDGGLWNNKGHASFFKVKQSDLLHSASPGLLQYFIYALEKPQGDPLAYLDREPDPNLKAKVLEMERNLWCVSILAWLGGEKVVWDGTDYAFWPSDHPCNQAAASELFGFSPVQVVAFPKGNVGYYTCGAAAKMMRFEVRDSARFGPGLAEMTARLLRE